MNQEDLDRVLGLLRTQGKAPLTALVRLFIRNGLSRDDIAEAFAFVARGLSDETTSLLAMGNAMAAGNIERKRGAFEEFYQVPREERNQRR
jgi:hypothetical protein